MGPTVRVKTRAAQRAEVASDFFQHRLEAVRVDAVGVHHGPDNRIGEHLLERRLAIIPVHGNSLWSVDQSTSMIRARPGYSAATRKGTTRSKCSISSGGSMNASTVSSARTRNHSE